MIAQLRGTLLNKSGTEVMLDVAGVGYEVSVPLTTLAELPQTGAQVLLHTHFVVREDAQQLFGFHDTQSKSLFRTLIKVNGVGPKLALGILSAMDAGEFVACVQANDVNAMVRLPGIGKKTAERLIIEMRDRLQDFSPADVTGAVAGAKPRPAEHSREAESALVSLGYKPQEAARSIAAVLKEHGDELGSDALIRLALKGML